METSKSIFKKVDALNEKMIFIDAPPSVAVKRNAKLLNQQQNIQPASQYIDQRLADLNEQIDLSELLEILEKEKKKIQDFADEKLKELALLAAKMAAKIASVLPNITIPPIVEQAAEQIQKIKDSVADRILASTINIELKSNLNKCERIRKKEAQNKKKENKKENK